MKRILPLAIAVCAVVALAIDNVHLRTRLERPERGRELPTGIYRSGVTPEVERELQRIAALGYVAGAERAPEVSGVLTYDRDAAFAGFTLYTCAERPEASLIDMEGRVVHSWSSPGSVYWARARLLQNGDLLVIAANPPYMMRLTSDSRVVWTYDGKVHHDFAVMPDGSIYVLVQEAVSRPDISDGAPLLDDYIVLLDSAGRELERVSLLDAFLKSEERSGWLADHPFPDDGDIFHTNSIEVFSSGGHTRALLSVRHIHTIAILDMETREIVFAMDGPWRKQHEVQFVGNNLLLFDNLGLTEELGNDGQSRVLEIDPRTRELVWCYTEPGFFTHAGGAQQRLPNGNTLITETVEGRVFEVTPDRRIVWEYVNPLRVESEPDLVLAILRAQRIQADSIADRLLSMWSESAGGVGDGSGQAALDARG